MRSTTRVTELKSLASVQNMTLAWQALYGQTRAASFFQTLDWFSGFCNDHNAAPRVLRVDAPGQLLGIIPLVHRRVKRSWGVVRMLGYPLPDWGTTCGPLGSNPTAVLLAAFRYLRQQPVDWDVIELAGINRMEVDHRRTLWAMQQTGWSVRETSMNRFGRLRITPTDSHPTSLQYRCFSPQRHELPEPAPDWLAIAQRLANRHSALNVSHRSGRALHDLACDRGAVQVHAWFQQEQPVAAAYYLRTDTELVELARGIDHDAEDQIDHAAVLGQVMQSNPDHEAIILDRTAPTPEGFDLESLITHRYTYARRTSARAQLWRLRAAWEDRSKQATGYS